MENILLTSVLTWGACNYLSSICFIEDIISFVFPSKEDIASVFCCNEHSAFCRSEQIFQVRHCSFLKHKELVFNDSLTPDKDCLACFSPCLGLTGMYKQNADNSRVDTPLLVKSSGKKP